MICPNCIYTFAGWNPCDLHDLDTCCKMWDLYNLDLVHGVDESMDNDLDDPYSRS